MAPHTAFVPGIEHTNDLGIEHINAPYTFLCLAQAREESGFVGKLVLAEEAPLAQAREEPGRADEPMALEDSTYLLQTWEEARDAQTRKEARDAQARVKARLTQARGLYAGVWLLNTFEPSGDGCKLPAPDRFEWCKHF